MDGERRESWFAARGKVFRFVYPIHWKGYALQLGSLVVLLAWFGIAIKLGIMADRTWLFALGAGLIGAAVMYVTAQHTTRDS